MERLKVHSLKDHFFTFLSKNKETTSTAGGREEFLIRDDFLSSNILMDYNIKPQDILYLFTNNELIKFCGQNKIKKSGNVVLNILNGYKDIENIYLENYELFALRDINGLKENDIFLREAEIGIKYEDLTKKIFTELGFNVDEKLRRSLSTKRDKMDIVLNLGNNNVIIIECKTKKDREYNKYTSVSRQIKSYRNQCVEKGYNIDKIILVAPDFSDDFISACEDDYELRLSLIPASGLIKIRNAFKESLKEKLPLGILSRAVLIDADRIIRNL